MNALMSIFVLLLIIRTLSILVSLRSTLQNEKMTEVQGKIAEINAKYKDLKDMTSRQKKQQETMEVYKKHNVKPFAAFEQMFITLPIFLIVYRVVTILRPLKATSLFGI
jgi:YidC/Oxa1 family membrane protein insertase